jgi:hypothetical protein
MLFSDSSVKLVSVFAVFAISLGDTGLIWAPIAHRGDEVG